MEFEKHITMFDDDVEGKCCSKLAFRLNKLYLSCQNTERFRNIDDFAMALISIADHVTDAIVLRIIFRDSQISKWIFGLSLVFLSTTTVIPALLMNTLFLRLMFLFGMGMLALIYQVRSNPDNLTKLVDARNSRQELYPIKICIRNLEIAFTTVPKEERRNMVEKTRYYMKKSRRFGYSSREFDHILDSVFNFKNGNRAMVMFTQRDLAWASNIVHEFDHKESIAILTIEAPKLYKLLEASAESLPQLAIQLYVAVITGEDSDPFLLTSLAISILSHAYAGAVLMLPNGWFEWAVALLYTFCDTLWRTLAFVYLFVNAKYDSPRNYTFGIYVFSSSLLWGMWLNRRTDFKEKYILLPMLVFILAYVFTFSSTTGMFTLIGGLNWNNVNMQELIRREMIYRFFCTALFLYVGYRSEDTEQFWILVASAASGVVSLSIYFFSSFVLSSYERIPQNDLLFILLEPQAGMIFVMQQLFWVGFPCALISLSYHAPETISLYTDIRLMWLTISMLSFGLMMMLLPYCCLPCMGILFESRLEDILLYCVVGLCCLPCGILAIVCAILYGIFYIVKFVYEDHKRAIAILFKVWGFDVEKITGDEDDVQLQMGCCGTMSFWMVTFGFCQLFLLITVLAQPDITADIEFFLVLIPTWMLSLWGYRFYLVRDVVSQTCRMLFWDPPLRSCGYISDDEFSRILEYSEEEEEEEELVLDPKDKKEDTEVDSVLHVKSEKVE